MSMQVTCIVTVNHVTIGSNLKLKTQECRVGSIYFQYRVAWQKVP